MRHLHYDSTDSTNSLARRLIEAGGHAPLIVSAATQTAGRGRNGRVWQSPRGGAWMSVVWPMNKSPDHYLAAPLVAGLATLRVIRDLVKVVHPKRSPEALIKWPNDVLLDGRKVAGILCEPILQANRPTHLIIGVGVNVDFGVDELHGQLRHPPTTLRAALGKALSVENVVNRFAAEVERLFADFDRDGLTPDPIREIRSRLAYVGTSQTWHFGDETLVGDIEGIDPQGRLLLNVEGVTRALDHGELTRVSPDQLRNLV